MKREKSVVKSGFKFEMKKITLSIFFCFFNFVYSLK